MAKPKLWLKKRTSRGKNFGGNPRKVAKNPQFSRKNLTREIYKNQRWYSHFLLKFVLCAIFAIFWIKLPFAVKIFGFWISIFPLGFCLGLIILALEKAKKYRLIEFFILLIFMILSAIFEIAVAI